MKNAGAICLIAVAAMAVNVAGCGNKKPKGAVATIGDEAITKESFQASIETLPPQWKARAGTPSGRKQILEHQVRSQLIELEAKDRGIDQRPDVKYQVEQAVQRILLQELMKEWQKEFKIPDEELNNYFLQNKTKFEEPEKFRAQHVLIKVEENASPAEVERARQKALAARKRIVGGEPFEKVAKEVSEGPAAANGGDLGYVERGRFHEKFEAVALGLKQDEISEPVRTPFGWHVIRLVDVRAAQGKSFEEVKDEIRNEIMPRKRQEAFEAFMASLKDKYKVEIDEAALAEALPESKSDSAAN